MKAFHGSQEIKDKYLARVRAHRAADEIVKGQYWESAEDGVFRGCAVGCTLHSNDHAAYESELGISELLARLEDRIFEGLPEPQHLEWPERFLSAIEPGADLEMVWPRFAIWLLSDPEHGTMRLCRPDGVAATKVVIGLFERLLVGDKPDAEEWYAARRAAYAAYAAVAAYAAYAAAYAAYAATSAAYATTAAASAADAAASAAYAAYAAAAADAAAAYAAYATTAAAASDAAAARRNHYLVMADKLIELLKEAR